MVFYRQTSAAQQVALSTRASIVIIKTALKTENFEEALKTFRELKALWTGPSARRMADRMAMWGPPQLPGRLSPSWSTWPARTRRVARPSAAWFCTEPQEHELKRFLPELASVPLSEEVPRGQSGHGNRVAMVRVESSGFAWRAERVVGGWAWLLGVHLMVSEAVREKDEELLGQVEQLAREKEIAFTESTYGMLIKGYKGSDEKVEQLFLEALEKKPDAGPELCLALLLCCQQTRNFALAERAYEHFSKQMSLPILAAFIRFHSEVENYERVCDMYERDASPLREKAAGEGRSILDSRMECGAQG
ncbi:unnamed protein product [Durusdinium trenchii]|uniref:Uncharacterized protein n=1 Tax=Durusdinium trenchii TaxID=1381693 RepID=A0ABP0LZH2_9DINO